MSVSLFVYFEEGLPPPGAFGFYRADDDARHWVKTQAAFRMASIQHRMRQLYRKIGQIRAMSTAFGIGCGG
jgi:hypothetical protein